MVQEYLTYRNQEEALFAARGLLARIFLLWEGDAGSFGAFHYLRQARPLYDGARNDPATDAAHERVILFYLRAFQFLAKEYGPAVLDGIAEQLPPPREALGKGDLRFTSEALRDEMV